MYFRWYFLSFLGAGFLHRDGVTQEQINRDQARFDQPRIKPVAIKSTETAPAPSPTSPLKKLDRRTSFAFPDKDVTKLSFASKPSGVTVRGRDAYLTFLNGNYVELTQPVCGHIAFRSRWVVGSTRNQSSSSVFCFLFCFFTTPISTLANPFRPTMASWLANQSIYTLT